MQIKWKDGQVSELKSCLTEKPSESGEYLVVFVGETSGNIVTMRGVYYSAKHQKWNCFDNDTDTKYCYTEEDEEHSFWIPMPEVM